MKSKHHARILLAAGIAVVALLALRQFGGGEPNVSIDAVDREELVTHRKSAALAASPAMRTALETAVPVEAPAIELGVPSLDNESPLRPEGPARDFIRVQIVNMAPDLPLLDLRAVAVPSTFAAYVTGNAYQERLREPERYGWFVARADATGTFLLGPGLAPDTEYRMVVGGAGFASDDTYFKAPVTPGNSVEVELRQVLGIEVLFRGSEGKTVEFEEQWPPPVSLDRPSRSLNPIAACLNHLPQMVESPYLRRFALASRNGEVDLAVQARAALQGQPRHTELVMLKPTFGGLIQKEVRLDYGVPPTTRLTVAFPARLAAALSGQGFASRQRMTIELHPVLGLSEERDQKASATKHQIDFFPELDSGSDTWEVLSAPMGSYTALLRVQNTVIPLVKLPTDQVGSPEPFDLSGDGITLYVQETPFATAELTGVGPTESQNLSAVVFTVRDAAADRGESYQSALLLRPPYHFVILIDDRAPSKIRVELGGPAFCALEDSSGSDTFELKDGAHWRLRRVRAK